MKYKLVKRNRRLMIVDCVTDVAVYTPPEFIRITSRNSLQMLVNSANATGTLHIDLIIAFESASPRAAGYRKRTSNVCCFMSSS